MNEIHSVTGTRVRPPAERRQDLLSAAARLFADRGVPEVSVADITGQAGVAVGTFYRFFATKEAVLSDLRGDALEALQQRALQVVAAASPDDWWGTADRMVAEMIGFWFEDRVRAQVVLSAEFDDVAGTEAGLLRLFAAGLVLGQQLGAVTADLDPDITASLLVHGVMGVVYHRIVDGPEDAPVEPLIEELRRQLRRLLSPQGGTP